MAVKIQTADIDFNAGRSPDDDHWLYNGLDCCVTREIFDEVSGMVDDTCRQTYEFSKALQAPVLEMTLRGILVNKQRRYRVLKEFRQRLERLQWQFDKLCIEGVGMPGPVNWRSPPQLKKLLYDVMQLPVKKKRNANGIYAPATDRDALEKLSLYFIAEPICSHILALRDLGKSIGFLETGIDPDGRMRTDFQIAGTNTGRFSSSETDFETGTNLQNVTEKLRSIFVADPGYKLANLDLEQGDSRNVGAICWNLFSEHPDWNEQSAGAYLDACESGDLHTTVAKMTLKDLPWGSAPDREVAEAIFYRDKSYRQACKVLGHGSNYLGMPPTMAKHTKFPVQLVKGFQDSYFRAFPCIPAWHNSVRAAIARSAMLITPFGRRRFFFDRPTDPRTIREAVAYAPQSMTADEINTGILKLWRANRVQLLIQVHDSILFQYPEEEEDEILPWALEQLKTHLILAKGRDFYVPTDAATGWNWGYETADNPDGLRKWKGHDPRKRQETDFRLSLSGV